MKNNTIINYYILSHISQSHTYNQLIQPFDMFVFEKGTKISKGRGTNFNFRKGAC